VAPGAKGSGGSGSSSSSANDQGSKPKPVQADTSKTNSSSNAGSKANNKSTRSSNSVGRSIEMVEKFYCRPGDVFDAYLESDRVRAFTQSDAIVTKSVGGSFYLFGGSVEGQNLEVVENERIVQNWRFKSWPEDVYSRVTIAITSPADGETIVRLTQTGIPDEDKFGNANVVDMCYSGWRERIWGRMKQVFGFGC